MGAHQLEVAEAAALPASFRDPSGFVFVRDGRLLRQVNTVYREHYNALLESGLCGELCDAGLLIPHIEVEAEWSTARNCYRVLEPERVPFVSYPYEWCFSQLRDAALLTLEVQRRALERGLTLKDASAYNIQFRDGRPILIDTLSFESRPEGKPWIAYRQFCQHFLAPLLLMEGVDVRLSALLRQNLDGIPLDLASALLPRSSWLRPGPLLHIHLHARSIRRYSQVQVDGPTVRGRVSRVALLGLVDSLERTVRGLSWRPEGTEWADYTQNNNYSAAALDEKQRLVRDFLATIPHRPETVWDLGANTGTFSRIAAEVAERVVAFDVDPAAVELNYQRVRTAGESRILPLLIDLTNPSPGIGWAHRERDSLVERASADAILALALVHHLAISNNVPLDRIAEFFSQLGGYLVIEFVPTSDSQVQRLLASREDVFPNYTREGFERDFGRFFRILRTVDVTGSERRLYLMERLA